MKMKMKNNLGSTILALVILIIPIGVTALQQQQAYAPRDCGGCIEFKKLTHELEKNVINGVIDPNSVPPSPVVRDLLHTYAEEVTRIFLGGPDTIPEMLGDYQLEVLSLLSASPDQDKHVGVAFMQNFKKLTLDFEKAALDVFLPGQ